MKSRQNFPLISVIVPVYNVALYLRRCIESILEQTYTNFELILINDGSSDGSEEICNTYQSEDERITVINQANQGVSSARNRGLQIARGQYICFVDSDDYIDKSYLEVLYGLITEYNVDLAIVDREKVYENSLRKEENNITHVPDSLMNGEGLIIRLYEKDIFKSVWGKIYTKNITRELFFRDFKFGEDIEFNYKVYNRVGKAVKSGRKLYKYFQRKGSIVHSPFSMKNYDQVLLFHELYLDMRALKHPLLKSSLIRLYKTLLSMRYEATKEYKIKVNEKIKEIYKETRHDFFYNPGINIFLKLGIFLFYKYPLLYNLFRRGGELYNNIKHYRS